MTDKPSLYELHARASGKLSDKWDLYLEVYNEHLYRFRPKEINFLEIGIQNGGSLETWGLFFENALNIIGCDIDPKCNDLAFDDRRINVVIGDATSKETIEKIKLIAQSFDVIIEDGSHTSRDIIASFCEYFPKIRPGGVYIAEDLHCCYWNEWGGGPNSPYSGIEFFKALCDCLNYSHWNREDITQAGFINAIVGHYGFASSDELLDSILSIEFYDSVCIIRKADIGKLARITQRIIGGSEESVASGHKHISSLMPLFPQKDAPFWSLASLRAEAEKLHQEIAILAEEKIELARNNTRLASELNEIRSSSSWRITAPLRLFTKAAKSLIRLLRFS